MIDNTRRNFVTSCTLGACCALIASKTGVCDLVLANSNGSNMTENSFVLKDLPYQPNALAPYISEQTVTLHHDKHQKAYVDNTNKFLTEPQNIHLRTLTLVELIQEIQGDTSRTSLYNNAAQIHNHEMYWDCMTKPSNEINEPTGEIKEAIINTFGSYDAFTSEFKSKGLKLFGSGWIWLAFNHNFNKLMLLITPNGDALVSKVGITPLFACDLWEHSYYLDYQNVRGNYLDAFLKLTNWDYVNANLKSVINC